MIFVTVGTQLSFDRLVRGIDEWAARHPEEDVFIQTGKASYKPSHCRYAAYTPPEEWEELFQRAELVVSHAGMGTILKSLVLLKPLIVMPRQANLGEHRNDHQLATVRRFSSCQAIKIVNDSAELWSALSSPSPLRAENGRPESDNLNTLILALKRFTQSRV